MKTITDAGDPADERAFALRMASGNAIIYLQAVLVACFVDPRLTTHVMYGARHYSWGYATTLLAPTIFLATFFGIRRASSRGARCLAACVPLPAAELAAFPFFLPEFPHGAIVTWPTVVALSGLIATWLRYAAVRP